MLLLALAMLTATPASLRGVVAGAHGGDTIVLAAGRYAAVTFRAQTFIPALTVDAAAASVAAVRIYNSTGVVWHGGAIAGDLPASGIATGFGVVAQNSSGITISGIHITDVRTGIGFGAITGGTITGNWLSQMSSDGIDVAMSRTIAIDHNTCSNFALAPTAHPDCIQLWSHPTAAPTADITIAHNTVTGSMQGISLFNHVRDGVDDGGFDRVVIRDNQVRNIFSIGIAVGDCRGCTVRDNLVDSLPEFEHFAQLYIRGGSVEACGNIVPRVPRQGSPACPAS